MKDFNKSFSLLNDILRNRLSNYSLITHKNALVATFAAERITERIGESFNGMIQDSTHRDKSTVKLGQNRIYLFIF